MKNVIFIFLLLTAITPISAQSPAKKFFDLLYLSDKVTYTLRQTRSYIKGSYDEDCPETITFTRGSDMIQVSDCKPANTKSIQYLIGVKGDEVTLTFKTALWNDYNSTYTAHIDKQAVVDLTHQTLTKSALREKRILVLTYTDGGKVYKRFYENDNMKGK